MGIPNKLLLALGASLALMLPAFAPVAFAQTIPGTVQIVPTPTCGLSISPSSINYGSQSQGDISADVNLGLSNTGTSSGTVTLAGSNWLDSTLASQMAGTQTRHGVPGSPYLSKTPVTLAPSTIAIIGGGTTQIKAFQLQVALTNPAFTGTLSQTLTFASTC